ncbi:DUF2298 domain-containing protein [Dictyobacter arantiisoli]|uniref:Chlor_Arch_YYY domain protein n=1 Tax=Dictyobacter arantiisoli TaxID=2014874 RepID=A0A5A5TCK7_9CHLR|nr:DUF2298 domain-containing protein [Dictyobacter arantiisoli]GCF08749.1 hypothetical protein KDI_23130 [Dictyobacter arantiisoli]
MFELFQMWALVEVLGIAFLPLTITIFRNMPDRGWAWGKALAILIVSFCVWFPLMVLHFLPFNQFFIFGVVFVLLLLNGIGFFRTRHTLVQLIRSQKGYIIASELLFLLMVALLGWLRSFGPEITSYERFMDEGFLASIMRSQHFPPSDMWYAGSSINYYYYAHYIIAVLAKLLGQIPSVAFNTGISLLYGLVAVSLFGVTCNLIAWSRQRRKQAQAIVITTPDVNISEEPKTYPTHKALLFGIPFGLLTVAMALMFGNLASTLQYFAEHNTPAGYDWFGASRIIPKTINEFPAFSFLLSDFHAHVLSLPFTILAIGFAFNFLLEPEGQGIYAYGRGWRLPLTLFCVALSVGGLFVMNGWDLPTYLLLIVVCLVVQQWFSHEKVISAKLIGDVLLAVLPLAVLAFLCYSPFFFTFSSPSQGVGFTSLQDRSTLRYELLIYALFAFVFLSLLFSNMLARLITPVPAISGASGEENELQELTAVEETTEEETITSQIEERKGEGLISWSFVGTLTGLGFIVIGLLFQLFSPQNATWFVTLGITLTALAIVIENIHDRGYAFTLFLGALAFGLIAACEVVFLRDVFADNVPRMNTVFKFYFQAWILLSIACGTGLFYIIENVRVSNVLSARMRALRSVLAGGKIIWSACLLILVAASCIYPIFAPYYRFVQYSPITHQVGMFRSNNLDGMTYLKDDQALAGDYDAIRWLNAHISGTPVITEAVGDDYTNYARISAFTGLPTIMGWVGHEYQWRVTWYNKSSTNAADFNNRKNDVNQIYSDPNEQRVLSTMARYHVQYVYVGMLERSTYTGANLNRFASFMNTVYQANGVTIYQVKA